MKQKMTKKLYRQRIQGELANLPENYRLEIEDLLFDLLVKSEGWQASQTVGLTYSIGNEWDTHSLIEEAWGKGKRLALPKTQPKSRQMTFHLVEDWSQLKLGSYGIMEPIAGRVPPLSKEDLDLILVPGLLFNQAGYRLGYGGGYYDRYLKDFKGRTLSQLADFQIDESLPIGPYDVPVDQLIVAETNPS